MNPGRLDERVTIYRRDVSTSNAYNEEVESWTAVGMRWAKWAPASSGEGMTAAKVEGNIDGTFDVRRDDLTKTITGQYRVDRRNGEQFKLTGEPLYDRARGLYMTLPVRRMT